MKWNVVGYGMRAILKCCGEKRIVEGSLYFWNGNLETNSSIN